jgi:hypothetical protein
VCASVLRSKAYSMNRFGLMTNFSECRIYLAFGRANLLVTKIRCDVLSAGCIVKRWNFSEVLEHGSFS